MFYILLLYLLRKALYCHKRAAHDPDKKKYKCDECGKAFLNPCHLERHKNTHVSDKPHKVITLKLSSLLFFQDIY